MSALILRAVDERELLVVELEPVAVLVAGVRARLAAHGLVFNERPADEGLGVVSGLAIELADGKRFLIVHHEIPEQLALHVPARAADPAEMLQAFVEAIRLGRNDIIGLGEGVAAWPDWSAVASESSPPLVAPSADSEELSRLTAAWRERGVAEDLAGAERAVRALVRARPDDVGALLRLAGTIGYDRPTAAAALAAQAVELAPDNVAVLITAGYTYVEMHHFDQAEKCAQRLEGLVTTTETPAEVTVGLEGLVGRLAAARGHNSAAERHLRRALQARPRDLNYGLWLAEVLARQDRRNEAREIAKHALEQTPANPDLIAFLQTLAD